jgi:hypothetical protein
MKRPSFIIALVLTSLAALGCAAPAAAGDQVPFRGNFAGVAVATSFNFPIACGVTTGTGNATHLGQFAFEHPHCANLVAFTLTGTFRLVAANGDQVFADFTGQSTATPTTGVRLVEGTATVTGGTGRFEGATGTITLRRLFNTMTNATVGSFNGVISSPGAANH